MARVVLSSPCPRLRSTPTLHRRLSRSAFSLVEVLVALTIVGVVAGLSIPRLSKLSNQSRVQRAAQGLTMELQQAFAIAGRNRAPVVIRWSGTPGELRITNRSGSMTYRRTGTTGYGISGTEVSVTPATLTVFPNGLANDSLVVVVSKRGYSRTVRISRSGMVRSR